MKFIIKKASDWKYKLEKEIGTLEELIEFIKSTNDDVIVSAPGALSEGEWQLQIYDDYVE